MINVIEYIEDLEKTISVVSDYSKLKNKSILILGATGTIGKFLVNVLMLRNIKYKDNIKIYAGSKNEESITKNFSDYLKYDYFIPFPKDVTKSFTIDEKIDYIIHAASNSYPEAMNNTPVDIMLSNFIGTNNLLEYCKNNLNTKMIYISSGEVYGNYDKDEPIKEDYQGYIDILNPRNCYPVSKRASETLCISYFKQYNTNVTIVRPSHVYSPDYIKEDNKVHIYFMNQVLNKENITFKKGGQVLRTYSYIADVISGILTVMLKGEAGTSYNIASDNSDISLENMANYIAKIQNMKVEYIDMPKIDIQKNNQMTYAILDNNKLKSLGWYSIYDIYEGLNRTMTIRKKMIDNVK